MDHTLAVCVAEGLGKLLADLAHALKRKTFAFLDLVGEGSSLDELHHQKWRAFVVTDIEDRNDSRVGEHAGGPGLTKEPGPVLFGLIPGERGGMDGFEGDGASHYRITRLENAAHCSAPDLGDNFVPSNPFWDSHAVDCINWKSRAR
jgi:hypothetical protein